MMITHNVNTFQKITDAFKENDSFICYSCHVGRNTEGFGLSASDSAAVCENINTVRQLFAQCVYI